MMEFLGFASVVVVVLLFARFLMGGLADKETTKPSDTSRTPS
jgi:hypothetical protein